MEMLHTEHTEQKQVVALNGLPSSQSEICWQGGTSAHIPIVSLGKFLIVACVCLKCSWDITEYVDLFCLALKELKSNLFEEVGSNM